MPGIFFSYRRSDSRDSVGRIYDWFAQRMPERDLFLDIAAIPVGQDFRQIIRDALQRAAVMLIIIGPNWLSPHEGGMASRMFDENDPVRFEIETARHFSIPMIPILVNEASMPTSAQLPPSLQWFPAINAIAVRPGLDFRRDVERLRSVVSQYIPALADSDTTQTHFATDCPRCGRIDQVRKLSAVLAPPPMPQPPVDRRNMNYLSSFFWGLLVYFVSSNLLGIIGAAIYFAFKPSIGQWIVHLPQQQQTIGALLLLSFAILYIFVLCPFIANRIHRAIRTPGYNLDVHSYTVMLEEWKTRLPLWNALYYCTRDAIVFLPDVPFVANDANAFIDRYLQQFPAQVRNQVPVQADL